MRLVVRFLSQEDGEDLIEYGLLAAFAAAVATAAVISDPLGIKGSLKNAFERARTALNSQ
jgi:Flp pilus assembly pilin Flp